jgi:hypothetical protein
MRLAACSNEDAFDHHPARLRHAIALVAHSPFIDGAPAALPALVMPFFWRDVESVKIGQIDDRAVS